MNVGKTFKAIGNFISKNSPIITATAAVGGLITTVVLACKATPKYLLDIDNAIAEKGEELTRGEKAKIFVKAYGTTIVAGVVTTGAIVASPLLMKKNCDKVLTGALAAYTVAENKLEKLSTAIKEELPKKEQDKVKTNYAKQMVADNPVPDDLICPAGKMIFVESITGQQFVSDMNTVKAAQNWLNAKLLYKHDHHRDDEGVSVNDLLDQFPGTQWAAGANDFCWFYEENNPVEFDFAGAWDDTHERTVTVLDYSVQPDNRKAREIY